MGPSDTPQINVCRRLSNFVVPALAISTLAILSFYDGRLIAMPHLIALFTVAIILIVWKYTVQQLMKNPEDSELQSEDVSKLKPLLFVFFGFYLVCALLFVCIWYFELPHLVPAFCALWLLRKELGYLFFTQRISVMPSTTFKTSTWQRWLAGLLSIYMAICAAMFWAQRYLLYIPSHVDPSTQLERWSCDGETIGYCREVSTPHNVWLMMHGNAGQAAMRDYVLPRMTDRDALYVLEYPGYGSRPGQPSREAFNQAAKKAYHILREQFPSSPIGVIGESIGSGPASALALENKPPDQLVLIVPFDSLDQVVAERFFWLPVKLLLLDKWNNIQALQNYKGPVEIYGAHGDEVIPVLHARRLARSIPHSTFVEIGGRHNDWSLSEAVRIRSKLVPPKK